jgi:hypothetical protein
MGVTYAKGFFYVDDALPSIKSRKQSSATTIGGVVLHEILFHMHGNFIKDQLKNIKDPVKYALASGELMLLMYRHFANNRFGSYNPIMKKNISAHGHGEANLIYFTHDPGRVNTTTLKRLK